MYKLLLVTTREDVRAAFAGVPELHRLMFEPVAFRDTPQEALSFLSHTGADAVGIDLDGAEHRELAEALDARHPFLPVFRTYKRGDELRAELSRVREYLDVLRGDYSDYDSDEEMTVARLRNEILHRLLEERVQTEDELAGRLLLARSPLKPEYPAFLFEFELPEGARYLENRWHHGFDRLDLALRANFFGRILEPMVIGAALISADRLRVVACATEPLDERKVDLLSATVQEQVLATANRVKSYMDLELVCTSFRVLDRLGGLASPQT